MRTALRGAVCVCFATCAVYGQTAPPHPEFQVEKVSLSTPGTAGRVEQFDGTQFTIRNSTIAEILPFAFPRKENALSGVPAWFRSDRYDIVAKAPPGVTEANLALMWQSLLAREFRLAVHEEEMPTDAFALTVADGGPKLRKVPGPGYPACVRGGTDEQQEAECTSITLPNLLSYLSLVAPDYIDRPVVDQTGLKDTYELKLKWVPKRLFDGKPGLTIFDAITQQLGLKLEQRKLPVSVIVVDHAERPGRN